MKRSILALSAALILTPAHESLAWGRGSGGGGGGGGHSGNMGNGGYYNGGNNGRSMSPNGTQPVYSQQPVYSHGQQNSQCPVYSSCGNGRSSNPNYGGGGYEGNYGSTTGMYRGGWYGYQNMMNQPAGMGYRQNGRHQPMDDGWGRGSTMLCSPYGECYEQPVRRDRPRPIWVPGHYETK